MTTIARQELVLSGLDGSNPLAFLAALGAFRALNHVRPNDQVKLRWRQAQGAWRPVLVSAPPPDDIVDALYKVCRQTCDHPTLNLADNLTIGVDDFRSHLRQQSLLPDRQATAFAAAFGSEAIPTDNGLISDTALRTMAGAGHQHFLKTMRTILESVTMAHLHKALFEPWRYDDPLKGMNLRLDPMDEKRYALQWNNPSGDPTRNHSGNVLGANALAILGIPYLTVAPVGNKLQTTGFQGHLSRDCYWTWPIWNVPLSCDVVASVLTLAELQEQKIDHEKLTPRGIVAVYRSQRITTGKFRNFTPAESV